LKKCSKDNMMAVSGSDLCRTHGGTLPQVNLKAGEAIEIARAAILSDSVSKSILIERISTKIEEWRESLYYAEQGHEALINYEYEEGIIRGLEQALEIIQADSTSPIT
jgi:hypothetical protein